MTRTEPKNKYDQGESAILELVDGPRDSRFMITAKTVARDRLHGYDSTPLTVRNVKKATQFRGKDDFEAMVRRFMDLDITPVEHFDEVEESEEAVAMAREEEEAAAKFTESMAAPSKEPRLKSTR